MGVWMVEQQWRLSAEVVTPIRSVVECNTEEEAQKGAAKAVVEALKVLTGGQVIGEAKGEPIVLYQIG
jgi:hypothetical protein